MRTHRSPFHRLQYAAIAEGLTLIVLVFVAVPLKHLAGLPIATSIMGPLHGAMFLIYLGVVVDTTWGAMDEA